MPSATLPVRVPLEAFRDEFNLMIAGIDDESHQYINQMWQQLGTNKMSCAHLQQQVECVRREVMALSHTWPEGVSTMQVDLAFVRLMAWLLEHDVEHSFR